MRRVYLDNAATTPVRPEVVEVMTEYMLKHFGNPSSVHWFGREARRGLDRAREQVAGLIGASPEEVVFTSGGTEADNLAIKGTAALKGVQGKHMITSAVEHHAILHTTEYLEKQGMHVTYLAVDEYGAVDPAGVAHALRPETILVSVMLGNNEVGTLQPVKEIAALCREKGVYVHTDAVQAAGQIDIDVQDLGVDFMSISSHKIYGPKGIGALYVKKGRRVEPLAHGGGHERKRRAGTENLPGIVGFGMAAELSQKELPQRRQHLETLRDRLIHGILTNIKHSRLNGHPKHRLPNNCNVSIEFVEGEAMLLNLDLMGIAASSGSACTSGALEPSHVLLAMGLSHELAHGSLRFSLGRENTAEEVDYVIATLPGIVERLREMSPLYVGKE
ncbi:MAG: cysteine desulfurase NifS [Bacillota bacterium]